jgi:hypothetical protein
LARNWTTSTHRAITWGWTSMWRETGGEVRGGHPRWRPLSFRECDRGYRQHALWDYTLAISDDVLP